MKRAIKIIEQFTLTTIMAIRRLADDEAKIKYRRSHQFHLAQKKNNK